MHEQINGTENISPTLHVTKVALQNSKKKKHMLGQRGNHVEK